MRTSGITLVGHQGRRRLCLLTRHMSFRHKEPVLGCFPTMFSWCCTKEKLVEVMYVTSTRRRLELCCAFFRPRMCSRCFSPKGNLLEEPMSFALWMNSCQWKIKTILYFENSFQGTFPGEMGSLIKLIVVYVYIGSSLILPASIFFTHTPAWSEY